jgi:hypothetical protein
MNPVRHAPWMRLALVVPLLCACDGDPEPSGAAAEFPPPPAGAVLALGPSDYIAEPYYVMADEIDRWVETVAIYEPEETSRSWRRKALTNIALPTAVGAAIFPEDRRIAKEKFRALRELVLAERPLPGDGPQIEREHGHGLEIGLATWGIASKLDVGEWSEVFEVVGGFRMVRRVSEDPPDGFGPATPVSIEVLSLRYIPMAETQFVIEDARKKLGVTPLNPPGWDGILPEFYAYE